MNTKKRSLIILIIILSVISILVWRTEWFQQAVFPKRYWAEKVNKLERSIRVQEFMIRDTSIELAKMMATIKFDIAQEANLAEMTGIDSEKMIEEAAKTKMQEIENLRKSIDMMEKILSKEQKELEMARQKMAEYQ